MDSEDVLHPGDRFTINLQKQIKIDIVCNANFFWNAFDL